MKCGTRLPSTLEFMFDRAGSTAWVAVFPQSRKSGTKVFVTWISCIKHTKQVKYKASAYSILLIPIEAFFIVRATPSLTQLSSLHSFFRTMQNFSQPFDQPRADYGLPSRHRHLSAAFNPPITVLTRQGCIDLNISEKHSLRDAHPTCILPYPDQVPWSGNRQREKQTSTHKPATPITASSSQPYAPSPSEKPSCKRKRVPSEDAPMDPPTQEIAKGPLTPPPSPTSTQMAFQWGNFKEATGGSSAEAGRARDPSPPLDHEGDIVYEEVVQEGVATPATIEVGTPEEMEWDSS